LAQRIRRGNISATLTVNRTAPPTIRVNREMLTQLVALLGDLSGELSGKAEVAPPRLDGLIALRGVIETSDDEADGVLEERRAAVLDGWSLALDRLVDARAQGGERLAAVPSTPRHA